MATQAAPIGQTPRSEHIPDEDRRVIHEAGPFTVNIDALAADEWDAFADQFSDVSYDQTTSYTDVRWGAARASAVTLQRSGAPVAGARVVILRLPLVKQGVAYLKFGPLWRPRGQRPDPAALRQILKVLIEEYCLRRGHRLTVLPRPMPDLGDDVEAVFDELDFRRRPPAVDPYRYLVDVSLSEEKQLASLGQKWRYNLRKGLSHDLSVEIACVESGVAEFHELRQVMVRRKGFVDHDATELRLLAMAAGLPPGLRPVLFVVKRGALALAAAVVGRTGDVPIYLFGASRDEALDFNAGYVLQWRIIDWLRSEGERWYDLGGGAMNPQLEQFKRGLVGKAGRLLQVPSEREYWTDARGWLVGEAIFRARDLQRLVQPFLHGG